MAEQIGPRSGRVLGVGAHLIVFGSLANRDFNGVVACCARLGFDFIEVPLNITKLPHRVVLQTCVQHSLPVAGVHIGFPDVSNELKFDQMLEFAANIEAKKVICSGCAEGSPDDAAAQTIRILNKAGETAKSHGIQLYYHFFDYVFEAPANREAMVETILADTDSDAVRINIDTLWATVGGRDPASLIQQVGDRCDYFHFKDGLNLTSDDVVQFRPLGKGRVPLEECINAFFKLKHSADFVIEHDRAFRDPESDLRESMSWLRGRLSGKVCDV